MTNFLQIALVGAGAIGIRHIESLNKSKSANLAAIVDPSPAALQIAEVENVPQFNSIEDMLKEIKLDGIIIATPNQMHYQNAMDAIAAGLPMVIEKPICDNLNDAQKLVETALKANIPILVGHHRRHNPLLQRAKEIIDSGTLGKVISVHSSCWFYKDDAYFDTPWRRQEGAGPIMINAIHDIDTMCYLFGEIMSIQSTQSNHARGFEVEDTAAALITFASGVVSTLTISDAIVSPFNWEQTAGESSEYPILEGFSCLVGGSQGTLSIPSLEIRANASIRSWKEKLVTTQNPYKRGIPLDLQIENFCNVILGNAEPRVSGSDGLATLKAALAMKEGARTGETIFINSFVQRNPSEP